MIRRFLLSRATSPSSSTARYLRTVARRTRETSQYKDSDRSHNNFGNGPRTSAGVHKKILQYITGIPRCQIHMFNSPLIQESSPACLLSFSALTMSLALSSKPRFSFSPSSSPASASFSFLPNLLFTNATYPTSLKLRAVRSISRRWGDILASICAGGPFLFRRIALRVSSPRRSLSFSLVLLRIFSRRASKIASTNSGGNGVFALSRSFASLSEIS